MRVEAHDVEISFPGRALVQHLDLVVPSGQIAVLIGPSGSGKSTLLAALAGFRPVQAGTVTFRAAGQEPVAPQPDDVAWVPQGIGCLAARTTLDNVAISALSRGLRPAESRRIARRWLHEVGLGAHAEEPCGRLSGGERQRVALARALATGRPLVFADEPTSHLDAENTADVVRTIRGLQGRATVVVATHDPLVMEVSPLIYDLRAHTRER
ncbi:ABC transporter ATP-binding protein [Cellulomonas sp. GbtcB1]|uniref:ABC transporter ATP-binding protein n=1 Tax=Cellulomonas sp. GbtcB1 TaxID=2824746 RepID=UPI001C2F70FA|nr:ATP-binding cassette domain-containing protein [Cellulomonas sp. GbtcB1]